MRGRYPAGYRGRYEEEDISAQARAAAGEQRPRDRPTPAGFPEPGLTALVIIAIVDATQPQIVGP